MGPGVMEILLWKYECELLEMISQLKSCSSLQLYVSYCTLSPSDIENVFYLALASLTLYGQ